MQLHIETRELEYYAMVRTRPGAPLGEGIQPSTTDCAAYYQARERRRSGAPQNTMPTGYCGFRSGSRGLLMTLLLGSVVMSIFAEQLQIFVGDLVRDETRLEGRFDIELTFVRDPALSPALPVPLFRNAEPAVGPSVFAAVQEQLGLRLQRGGGWWKCWW